MADNRADGEIIIDTEIRTDGMTLGSKEIEQSLKRMSSKLKGLSDYQKNALQNMLTSFNKLNQEYAKQSAELARLKRQQEELDSAPASNKAMDTLVMKMDNAEQAYRELIARQKELRRELIAPGLDKVASPSEIENILKKSEAYRKLTADIEATKASMDSLNREYQEASANYTGGLDAKKAANLDAIRNTTERLSATNNQLSNSYRTVKETVKGYSNELKKNKTHSKKANNATKRLKGSLLGVHKSAKKAAMSIKRMLAQSLLFAVVFRIYSAVMEGMGEGINNLVLYSDSLNDAMSRLMGSMLQLKNAFGTAFQPIIEFVTPALEQLISHLSEALTWVSHFFSALTGKTSYTVAKKVQQDYRESIDDTTDAMKDQEKVLYSFDTIERATEAKKENEKDDPNKLDPEQMFETKPVQTEMQAFADNVKETFSKIFDPFKEAWEQKGGAVMDSAKYALREIMALAQSVGESFLQVWNNEGYGERITANVLEGVSNLLEAVGYLAHNFRTAWEEGDRGTSIMRGLLTIVETVSNIFLRSTEIIKDWALNLDFSPLLQAVDEVLPYINDTIERVGEVILWLLENVIAPVAKAIIEDLLPRLINILGGVLDVVNALFDALAPLVDDIFNNFLQPLVSFAWDTIMSGLDGIVNALHRVADWIRQNSGLVQNITKLLVAFFAVWEVTKILAFVQQSGGVVGAFKNIATAIGGATAAKVKDVAETVALTALYAVDFVKGIASATVEVGKHAVELVKLAAKQVFVAGKQKLLTAATTAWNKLCTAGKAATQLLSNGFTLLGNALQTPLGKFTLIAGAITGLIALAATLAKNWNAMTPTERMISGLLAAGSAAAVLAVAVGAIGGAAGAAVVAGAIVAGIAAATIAINAGKRQVQSASSAQSRSSGGYALRSAYIPTSTAYIPKLASGTVVPPRAGEFAAILGDNNREAEVVSPLSTMKQALKEAIAEVGGLAGGSRDIHVDLVLDGKKFASAVYKANNQETQRVGVRLVTSG